nr:SseB family protein [Arthrobacter roseus]
MPEHIVAALRRAGGKADSAGALWEGRDLSASGNPLHDFDNDDGSVNAHYQGAVDLLVAGECGENAVVQALSQARVFVPIVAELSTEASGQLGIVSDKEADMALIWLQAPDGRKALPIFSCVAHMQRWHSDARPVAVYAPRAALSAVSEGAELLVVDPGSNFTFVVRRPALWALAQQASWNPSYEDPDVAILLKAAVAEESLVNKVIAQPGPGIASRTAAGSVVAGGGPGPELLVWLQLLPGLGAAEVQKVAARFRERLASNSCFTEKVDSLEVRLTD